MSPEGAAHFIGRYLESLEIQARAVKALYLGKVEEGVSLLLSLPLSVQEEIEEKVKERGNLLEAILGSLEERMGAC